MIRPVLPALAALLAACAGPRELVVASDLDNRPFAFVDEAGVPAGRDVEMMAAIGARLGRGIAWRRMAFEEILPAVERGEVDVACATLGVTPERAERVAFSAPYFETGIAVVVRRGPGEPRAHADLAGRRVLAGRGTTSERAARLHIPGAELVLEREGGRSVLELLEGRGIDAAVMDGPDAARLVAAHGASLARLADLEAERYALALPRGRDALLAELDAALEELREEGALAELDARFGL